VVKNAVADKELKITKAYIWEKEQINKTIDFREKIPPRVCRYSTNVL
jgi:hypothetical protein